MAFDRRAPPRGAGDQSSDRVERGKNRRWPSGFPQFLSGFYAHYFNFPEISWGKFPTQTSCSCAFQAFFRADDVASALAIGILEAKQLHQEGKKKDYPLFYLAILIAARQLGLRHAGGGFQRCGRSAVAVSIDDGIDFFEPAHLEDPASILEACEAVSGLDPLLISSLLAGAECDSICTSQIALHGGITARAARYRKAKARAVAVVQGDLFGEAV